jgi:hypothetical protein
VSDTLRDAFGGIGHGWTDWLRVSNPVTAGMHQTTDMSRSTSSCHAGLNKSGQRHAPAQMICAFHQGRIGARNAEAQQFRAADLNLATAAIVYRNSTYPADALAHLRAAAELVPAELLPHTSPLGWEHIRLSGDFLVGTDRGLGQQTALPQPRVAPGRRLIGRIPSRCKRCLANS